MASANRTSSYLYCGDETIQGSRFNFDHQMIQKHLSRLNEAVHVGIWEQLCPDRFICTDNCKTMKIDRGYIIKKFAADIK